jgi:hypothetical protein
MADTGLQASAPTQTDGTGRILEFTAIRRVLSTTINYHRFGPTYLFQYRIVADAGRGDAGNAKRYWAARDSAISDRSAVTS